MRVGILGDSNTGKSFSWAFYDRPDEVFSICPTTKIETLGAISHPDFNIQDLNISYDGKDMGNTILHFQKEYNGAPGLVKLINHMVNTPSLASDPKMKVTGHVQMVSNINSVSMMKRLVSMYMPEKRIILTHDFGHYLNYIMQSSEFRARKAGDQAYARFWDMASDALEQIFFSPNSLRYGMIDVTEFHVQLDADMGKYDIFAPGGKMLQDKFKGKSYFDIALFSRVIPFEEQAVQKERYKFVAVQKDYFDGRDLNLLHDLIDHKGEISNYMITQIMDRILVYIDKRKK